MTFPFFDRMARYFAACGLPPSTAAPSSSAGNNNNVLIIWPPQNSTAAPSANTDRCAGVSEQVQVAWSVLQSVVALMLFVLVGIVGLRTARKPSQASAILPMVIAIYFVIAFTVHGIVFASSDTTTLGFYDEVYMWAAAIVATVLILAVDGRWRVVDACVAIFSTMSLLIAILIVVELASPHTIADVSTAVACSIAGGMLLIGIGWGVVCGIQRSKAYDVGVSPHAVRAAYVLASFGQSWLVTALVFAACKFHGCRSMWNLRECTEDEQSAALGVLIGTLVVTGIAGVLSQCVAIFRENDEDAVFVPRRGLQQFMGGVAQRDMLNEDLAVRRAAGESNVPNFDSRWLNLTSPRGGDGAGESMMARGY